MISFALQCTAPCKDLQSLKLRKFLYRGKTLFLLKTSNAVYITFIIEKRRGDRAAKVWQHIFEGLSWVQEQEPEEGQDEEKLVHFQYNIITPLPFSSIYIECAKSSTLTHPISIVHDESFFYFRPLFLFHSADMK